MTIGLGNGAATPFTTLPPQAWDGTSFDARNFGSIKIWVLTSPSVAYNMQTSGNNSNWANTSGVDHTFTSQTNISTSFTGSISLSGGGYVQLSGGTGGNFLISAGQ